VRRPNSRHRTRTADAARPAEVDPSSAAPAVLRGLAMGRVGYL